MSTIIAINLGYFAAIALMIFIALSKFFTYSVYNFRNGAKFFMISPEM
jgi:hypothetical protein